MDHKNREEPLKPEALARDNWRGGEAFLDEKESGGHTLPESERDRAKMKSGDDEAGGAPRTMPPPD